MFFLHHNEEEEALTELKYLNKLIRGQQKKKAALVKKLIQVKEYKKAIKVMEGI